MLKILIVKYRSSRFHNAKNGRRLAKLMSIAVSLFRNPYRTKTINGITYELDLREVIDSSLYFTSTYEVKIDQLFDKYVKPAFTVVDIGANVGLHTLHSALLTGAEGLVLAIEPSIWAIRKLSRNLELNPRLSDQVSVLQCALGDKEERRTNLHFQSSYLLTGKNEATPEIIDVLTLDSIMENKNLQKVDLVKIDVDGHELHILRGAKNMLSTSKPVLIVEFTPSYSNTYLEELAEIDVFLASLGYQALTDEETIIPDLVQYLSCLPSGHSLMVLLTTK